MAADAVAGVTTKESSTGSIAARIHRAAVAPTVADSVLADLVQFHPVAFDLAGICVDSPSLFDVTRTTPSPDSSR